MLLLLVSVTFRDLAAHIFWQKEWILYFITKITHCETFGKKRMIYLVIIIFSIKVFKEKVQSSVTQLKIAQIVEKCCL